MKTQDHLTFSTGALENINALIYALDGQPDGARLGVGWFKLLAKLLREGQRFVLPEDGLLFDKPVDAFSSFYLPYPVTIAEMYASFVDRGIFGEGKSTRRIAIAIDLRDDMPVWDEYRLGDLLHMKKPKEEGVMIATVNYMDDAPSDMRWNPSPVVGFVPRDNYLETKETARPAGFDDGRSKKTGFAGSFYVVKGYGEMWVAKAAGDYLDAHPAATQQDMDDVMLLMMAREIETEAHGLLQMCAYLNCRNTVAVEMPAPAALNKKRLKSGKVPFFSYRVLDVKQERRVPVVHYAMSAADGRKSPAPHFRRGHIRQLDSGPVWIQSTVVRATAMGEQPVEKVYNLRSGQ